LFETNIEQAFVGSEIEPSRIQAIKQVVCLCRLDWKGLVYPTTASAVHSGIVEVQGRDYHDVAHDIFREKYCIFRNQNIAIGCAMPDRFGFSMRVKVKDEPEVPKHIPTHILKYILKLKCVAVIHTIYARYEINLPFHFGISGPSSRTAGWKSLGDLADQRNRWTEIGTNGVLDLTSAKSVPMNQQTTRESAYVEILASLSLLLLFDGIVFV